MRASSTLATVMFSCHTARPLHILRDSSANLSRKTISDCLSSRTLFSSPNGSWTKWPPMTAWLRITASIWRFLVVYSGRPHCTYLSRFLPLASISAAALFLHGWLCWHLVSSTEHSKWPGQSLERLYGEVMARSQWEMQQRRCQHARSLWVLLREGRISRACIYRT